jgi:hypothetical protein
VVNGTLLDTTKLPKTILSLLCNDFVKLPTSLPNSWDSCTGNAKHTGTTTT